MKKHGKKYREVVSKVSAGKTYLLDEAIALLKETSPTKFDSSCEVHVKLGVDPKQADQNIRSTVVLPHGSGKKVRVIAFVPDALVKTALDAGAVKAGSQDLINEVADGFLGFDVAVAHPEVMRDLAKVAKLLGQKGLMPNPKAGTVSPDVAKVVKELQAGKIEFRADKLGILHNIFGKHSFGEKELAENLKAYLSAVNQVKPASLKGTYFQSISLATSMGPGVRLDVQETLRSL